MNLLVLTLVLASALFHAGWNVLLKKRGDTTASAVSFASIACLIALVAGLPYLSSLMTYRAAVGTLLAGLAAGGALFAIGRAFEGGKLGILYAVSRSSSIVLLWPLAALLFSEQVGWNDIVGAVLITAAILSFGNEMRGHAELKYMAWSLGSGVLIVLYNLAYKFALKAGANQFALLGTSDMIRVGVAFMLIPKDRVSRMRVDFGTKPLMLVLMAILSFSSFSIFLHALKSEGAAHITTLRNLSILFATLGSIGIGEKPSLKQSLGIVAATAGTILVAL